MTNNDDKSFNGLNKCKEEEICSPKQEIAKHHEEEMCRKKRNVHRYLVCCCIIELTQKNVPWGS